MREKKARACWGNWSMWKDRMPPILTLPYRNTSMYGHAAFKDWILDMDRDNNKDLVLYRGHKMWPYPPTCHLRPHCIKGDNMVSHTGDRGF